MAEKSAVYDKERFAPVWDRVMQRGDAEHSEADIKQLREFMDDEATDERTYGEMSVKCRGMCQKTLMRLASDERRHFRRLRTLYFIMTGDTYAPEITKTSYAGLTAALRSRYDAETSGAAAYLAAAEKTDRADLKELYVSFAADEMRHASEIAGIIESMM